MLKTIFISVISFTFQTKIYLAVSRFITKLEHFKRTIFDSSFDKFFIIYFLTIF